MRTSAKLMGWVCAALIFSTGVTKAESLITNGDFESGNFNGWTVNAGTDPSHPPIVIGYNNTFGFPNGAYGESVPTPVNGLSSGAYFSADTAPQSISQKITLTAATPYTLSFDVYAPQNGRNNPFDASLFASLNGFAISKVFSADSLTNGWVYYSTTFIATAAAVYDFSLNFKGDGNTAADFVVDNVSVTDNPSLAAAIPEPHIWALLMIGFVVLGLTTRRQRTSAKPI